MKVLISTSGKNKSLSMQPKVKLTPEQKAKIKAQEERAKKRREANILKEKERLAKLRDMIKKQKAKCTAFEKDVTSASNEVEKLMSTEIKKAISKKTTAENYLSAAKRKLVDLETEFKVIKDSLRPPKNISFR